MFWSRKKKNYSKIFLPQKMTSHRRLKKGFFSSWTRIFVSTNKRRFFRLWKFLFRSLLVVAFIVIFITVFFSPFFSITSIHIKRADLLIDSGKIQKSLIHYLNENLLFVSKNEIRESILSAFPEIEDVIIYRRWPNQLHVQVTSFPTVANVKIPEGLSPDGAAEHAQKGLINSQGYIVDLKINDPQFPSIVIRDRRKLGLHEQIIPPEYLNVMIKSLRYFEEEFHVTPRSIDYYDDGREYHIILHNHTALWLDFTEDFEQQFLKLKRALPVFDFMKQAVQHVDLRIKGKLIYK